MRTGEKIRLKPISELLGVVNEESAMDIEISLIHSFKGHPFKVLDDEKMEELVESIKANGVLSPVLLRTDEANGGYEMISGHRRLHASTLAGLETIPAIIRDMTDDEAVIAMVDANIQREELLPSEKAFAFKMKMEAMKRQGSRGNATSDQNGPRLTAWSIGEDNGISGTQVKRYIRLTELIPDLMNLVDQKRLGFTLAVDISYIDKTVQTWLYEYICNNGAVRPNQITELRTALETRIVDRDRMITILRGAESGKNVSGRIYLKEKKLRSFFPSYYSTKDMEKVIWELLALWKEEKISEV